MSHGQSQGLKNRITSSLVAVTTCVATIGIYKSILVGVLGKHFLFGEEELNQGGDRLQIDQQRSDGKDSIFSSSVVVKILKTETSNI